MTARFVRFQSWTTCPSRCSRRRRGLRRTNRGCRGEGGLARRSPAPASARQVSARFEPACIVRVCSPRRGARLFLGNHFRRPIFRSSWRPARLPSRLHATDTDGYNCSIISEASPRARRRQYRNIGFFIKNRVGTPVWLVARSSIAERCTPSADDESCEKRTGNRRWRCGRPLFGNSRRYDVGQARLPKSTGQGQSNIATAFLRLDPPLCVALAVLRGNAR